MNASTKQTIGVLFLCALIAFLLALIPMDCHAETLTPDAALTAWNTANDACIGAQIEPDKNPACKRRDALTRALMKHGYRLFNHDVWVSHDQMLALKNVLTFYNTQFAANPLESESIMPAMMQAAVRAVPLPQIFAMWNDPELRAAIRDAWPGAWALMSEGMRQIAAYHSQEHNPALTLDY